MTASPAPRTVASPGVDTGLPLRAGVGLKPQHYGELLTDDAPPAFVEVHAENYMGAGGAPHAWLTRIRDRLPLSLHGVGLSIGADGPLDAAHLDRLAALIARYQPGAFSEHLAWSTHGDVHLNDLLPLSYDPATLARVCDHIDAIHERLGVRMLLENPSTYFEFRSSTMAEAEFIAQVVRRTGCGLLLDINNVHVSCSNHGRDALDYLDALPLGAVGEVHLAGHAEEVAEDGDRLLIDHHGAPVAEAVWRLYAQALARLGPVATLIEWDNDVPGYPILRAEAQRAQRALDAIAPVHDDLAA